MKLFRSHNWYLTTLLLLLCFTGIATIFSLTTGTLKEDLVIKQIVFILVGLIIYFIISKINPVYLNFGFIISGIFLLNVSLLILTLIIARSINGARRWIEIGQFSLQASEFAKIVIVIVLAYILSTLHKKFIDNKEEIIYKTKNKFINFILQHFSFIIVLIPSIILITLILFQKSLSQSVIILLLSIFMFFFSYLCTYKRFFLYIFVIATPIFLLFQNLWNKDYNLVVMGGMIGVALLAVIFKFANYIVTGFFILLSVLIFFFGSYFTSNVILKAYQQERIDAFLDENNPKYYWGENRQQREAKNAFGSGQIFGKGFGIGNESRLSSVAYAESDFIFAAFGEQFGFLGVLILFILYSLLIFEIVRVSDQTVDEKGRLICYGVAILILLQVIIHICVNLRILPNTGVALPLIGYGGSSMLTFMISLGLVQAVSNNVKKLSYSTDDSWNETYQ